MKVDFDEITGFLPPGIYDVSWKEFCEWFGFTPKREAMLDDIYLFLCDLKYADCKDVSIGGSFVTNEKNPDDFDGTWNHKGIDKSKLDPIIESGKKEKMKLKYKGELYSDEGISGEIMTNLFRFSRKKIEKGVVRIKLETMK